MTGIEIYDKVERLTNWGLTRLARNKKGICGYEWSED